MFRGLGFRAFILEACGPRPTSTLHIPWIPTVRDHVPLFKGTGRVPGVQVNPESMSRALKFGSITLRTLKQRLVWVAVKELKLSYHNGYI